MAAAAAARRSPSGLTSSPAAGGPTRPGGSSSSIRSVASSTNSASSSVSVGYPFPGPSSSHREPLGGVSQQHQPSTSSPASPGAQPRDTTASEEKQSEDSPLPSSLAPARPPRRRPLSGLSNASSISSQSRGSLDPPARDYADHQGREKDDYRDYSTLPPAQTTSMDSSLASSSSSSSGSGQNPLLRGHPGAQRSSYIASSRPPFAAQSQQPDPYPSSSSVAAAPAGPSGPSGSSGVASAYHNPTNGLARANSGSVYGSQYQQQQQRPGAVSSNSSPVIMGAEQHTPGGPSQHQQQPNYARARTNTAPSLSQSQGYAWDSQAGKQSHPCVLRVGRTRCLGSSRSQRPWMRPSLFCFFGGSLC